MSADKSILSRLEKDGLEAPRVQLPGETPEPTPSSERYRVHSPDSIKSLLNLKCSLDCGTARRKKQLHLWQPRLLPKSWSFRTQYRQP